MRAQVIPATPELLAAALGRPPEHEMHAMAMIEDGKVLGIGGHFVVAGRLVMFANLTPQARSSQKRALLVAAKKAVLEARQTGQPVVTIADKRVPGVERWLERLGFRPTHDPFYELA